MADFIGFFIALFFLLVSALVRRREKRDREEHPEKYKEQDAQEAAMLKELLQGLDMQAEGPPPAKKKKVKPPPRPTPKAKKQQAPKRRVGDQYEFEAGIDSRHQGSAITERHLDLAIDEHTGESHFSDKYENVPHGDVWAVRGRSGPSRASKLVEGVKSKRDVILLHEIIGKPKADQF